MSLDIFAALIKSALFPQHLKFVMYHFAPASGSRPLVPISEPYFLYKVLSNTVRHVPHASVVLSHIIL